MLCPAVVDIVSAGCEQQLLSILLFAMIHGIMDTNAQYIGSFAQLKYSFNLHVLPEGCI